MVNTDHARKLLVRSALVTGSTIATLVGAQNLAMLDESQFQQTTPVDLSAGEATQDVQVEIIEVIPPTLAETVTPITTELPQATATNVIAHAAPSITVLRQSGNPGAAISNTSSNAGSTAPIAIQPPVASLLAPPAPIVVQSQQQTTYVTVPQAAPVNQPVQQNTSSSR
jgi:hypothetical protein